MKKNIKRFLLAITVVFALLGIGGIVAFASGYIEWGGSDDFRTTSANLDEILRLGNELQKDLNNKEVELVELREDNKRLEDETNEKQELINEKQELIDDLEAEKVANEKIYNDLVNHLSNFITRTNNENGLRGKFDLMRDGANTLASMTGITGRINNISGKDAEDDQLKQAEEDMNALKEKSESVLESFKDNSEE